MTPQDQLKNLIQRLENLQRSHQNTGIEIVKLREEVSLLKKEIGLPKEDSLASKALAIDEIPPASIEKEEIPEVNIDFSNKPKSIPPPLPKSIERTKKKPIPKPAKPFDLEAFIGGNLINKIGILILIVGLGLFVKYAIDNGYFPPLVRLILSFLAGLTLVGIGYRLKEKYKTYSAVLFSGGMAVLYFSAYGGNAFYDPILLPKVTAFILMVVFTIVTVLAATIYSLEIIALLGLVGAYAVPILLSDNTGDYKLLFSYMAIINTGILLVTIRRNWRLTLYIAFILTWLIFAFWVLVEYSTLTDSNIAWTFNVIFFLIFYAALITYKLLKKLDFAIDNVLFITFNAFIFYGLGMVLLENSDLDKYQGIFTLLNGVLHLGIAFGTYKKMADKKLFYVISSLFWIFLTIAIGVQFDSEIRPILWLGEAVLLFGLGRRFKIRLYEGAAFLVLFLGLNFLLQTWAEGYYNSSTHHTLILNRYFLSSVFALLAIGMMFWINEKWKEEWSITPVVNLIVPALFIALLYFSFFNEIYHQFDQAFMNSEIDGKFDYSIRNFMGVWLINYSFLFVLLMMGFNRFYLKNRVFGTMAIGLAIFTMIIFLTLGMYTLHELRDAYLNPQDSPDFHESTYWIWIRYITYLFAGLVLYGVSKSLKWLDSNKIIKSFFQLFVYLVVLVVLSNELTTFMRLVVGVDTSSLTHKVGFSILWALYSLMMILLGFKQRSKIMRIAGIALFAVTLIKVFFIDLIDISTESKILLFIAIGVLLLVTSYLYQRYKDVLLGDGEEEKEENITT